MNDTTSQPRIVTPEGREHMLGCSCYLLTRPPLTPCGCWCHEPDVEHGAQVRSRISRGIMDPSQVLADLTRLLARAERAEQERDRALNRLATEPDRTRAAVVKALEEAAERAHHWSHSAEDAVREYADAIENGADL